MPTIHAKLLRISAPSFAKLKEALAAYKYDAKKGEGFVIDSETPGRIEGRYFFPKLTKTSGINKETLEDEERLHEVMQRCHFEMNLNRRLLTVTDRSSDTKQLSEVMLGMPGVSHELENCNSDCIEIFRALREATPGGKLDLRALRVKDYMGREGLITSANFKLLEPGREEEIFGRYQPETQAFTASLMTDDGLQTITLARKGSIRFSDGFPADLVEMAKGFLHQFHDAVEVETVKV